MLCVMSFCGSSLGPDVSYIEEAAIGFYRRCFKVVFYHVGTWKTVDTDEVKLVDIVVSMDPVSDHCGVV